MKQILNSVNNYLRQSDWKDLAFIKFCLCAAGMLFGLAIPPKHRKPASFCAAFVFVVSFIPLICRFFETVQLEKRER